jgi:hypothetical protein
VIDFLGGIPMLFQELTDEIKKKGEDQALGLIAHFNTPPGFAPVDVYKAVCSIKCAEVLARSISSPAYFAVIEVVATFIEKTMKIVDGDAGSATNGRQVLAMIEFIAPFREKATTEEFAIRQAMFDAVILDASKKLNIEAPAKESIDGFHRDMFIAVLKDSSTPVVRIPGDPSEIN